MVACSGERVSRADYFEKTYKFGEIVNSLDVDVYMKFKLSYEKFDDSVCANIAKGDTFYFNDSLRHLIPFFIEDLLGSFPEAKFEASMEFETLPPRCLHFVGPVTDEKFDIRSQYAYQEIDTTVVEGDSYKRLTIDSGLYKMTSLCE